MECEELRGALYEFDLQAIARAVRETGAKRLVLQAPDGLKHYYPALVSCLKRLLGDVEVYVSGEGVYGACDLDLEVLEATLKPDLIIHIGHTPYPLELCSRSTRLRLEKTRVVYIPAFSKLEVPEHLVREASEVLRSHGARRVGLVATIQHARELRRLATLLEKEGLEPVIPQGSPPHLLDGQVIGCDYRVAKGASVDAYVYLGGGLFHPLGLYLAVGKPVVKIDPYEERVVDVTPLGVKHLKIRLYKIQEASRAERWAVIVGLKTCQYRDWVVENVRRLLEEKRRDYIMIAVGVLTLERLASIDNSWIQAFVVTSCPRLPVDDFWDYPKPVLTPLEAKMALTGSIESQLF